MLVWPAVLVSLEPAKWLCLVASPMTQAMATAVAGFFFGLYLHYKSRQTSTETLLRAIVFSDLTTPRLADPVAEELSRVNQGMRFRAKAEEKADD